MSKRSGNSRRSTRSKRRERREEEKEEPTFTYIRTILNRNHRVISKRGNRWISGLIKSSSGRSCSLSRQRIQDQIFLREKKSRSQQRRLDRLGLFVFFLSSYFPSRLHRLFAGEKTEKIANLSRRNPLRMADISAGERRRRIWRVLDRSVFSFSPLPLPYEAVE